MYFQITIFSTYMTYMSTQACLSNYKVQVKTTEEIHNKFWSPSI